MTGERRLKPLLMRMWEADRVSLTEGGAEPRAQAAVPPILEIRDIAKRFGATQALEAVSLTL